MIGNSKAKTLLFITITMTLTLFGCDKKEKDPGKPKPQTKSMQNTPDFLLTPPPEFIMDPTNFDEVASPEYVAKENKLWEQDYNEAKKIASEQNKDIFINFTGFTIFSKELRIKKEIFSKQIFINEIQKNFVLLKLDFSKDDTAMDEDAVNKNNDLKEKYGINGFPTIILTDASGKPYGRTSYKEGGPEKFIEHIHEFLLTKQQMLTLLEKADNPTIEGTEKAKLIDEALSLTPMGVVCRFYADRLDQVIELDSENKASLKNKYKLARRVDELCFLISEHENKQKDNEDFNIAIKFADDLIKEFNPKGQSLQTIYLYKGNAYYHMEDHTNAKKTLQMAIDVAPESKLAEVIKASLKIAEITHPD